MRDRKNKGTHAYPKPRVHSRAINTWAKRRRPPLVSNTDLRLDVRREFMLELCHGMAIAHALIEAVIHL